MRITWRDFVMTLTTIGAIALERAYSLNWGWPLTSEITWVIIGIAFLIAIGLLVSYASDTLSNSSWNWAMGLLATSAVLLTGLGLYFKEDIYMALLTVNAIVVWAASVIYHLATPRHTTHLET